MDHSKAYSHLGWMGLLHLPIMYAVMFAMVDTRGDVYHNLNTFYMAGMMAAPMMILMPILMASMYPDRKKNLLVYGVSALIFVALYLFIRQQTFIGDRQFVRSMIPHHSGAILMCREAKLQDAELRSLCDAIIQAQRSEIQQMEKILERL